MRLKSFTGTTMADVMEAVRQDLGDDAIIISSWKEGDGAVRVTAALERAAPDSEAGQETATGSENAPTTKVRRDRQAVLRQIFDYHGVPSELSARLAIAALAIDHEDTTLALAAAVDDQFSFSPVGGWPMARPIILVGPHGSGKTVTTAKLAAQQALSGRPVGVLTVDPGRASALADLTSYTEILGIDLGVCDSPRGLADRLGDEDAGGPVFIDSAAVDPFNPDDMARLGDYVAAARAEPVLVLSAGIDPLEAADVAACFRALGANRLMTARVDVARRYGGILAAAEAGDMIIGSVGVTAHIADGLASLNPVSLARLLAQDPAGAERLPAAREAAL